MRLHGTPAEVLITALSGCQKPRLFVVHFLVDFTATPLRNILDNILAKYPVRNPGDIGIKRYID